MSHGMMDHFLNEIIDAGCDSSIQQSFSGKSSWFIQGNECHKTFKVKETNSS